MSTLPPDSAPSPAPAAGTDHDALPPGTRFGEFEILRVLGVGGFGIVYLANDHSLEREVALKEYMPASLAARGQGPQITVRSSSFAETYAIGLRSFVNEARLLARFDHPSLVKVYRFWEDNATAYMVMPFLQGVTLRDTRRRMAHPPDEAWIRSVISPILSALELLHREGVYHRDIAPDNILLPPDGPPVLLDFGAARRVISDRTQSLTAILKPSYAPIEQYAEMTQLRQGPWTDLYALGAVIHYLLFGAPPAPATARAVQDDAEAIENRIVPGVSPRFLEAVSWMLSVRPNQRPQNGEQLRAVLDGSAQIPARGRPGITIPPNVAIPVAPAMAAYPPAQPPGPVQRHQVETAGDATYINTAHIPTHMPTAHVPPPGQTRGPTTSFSPTAQMPTARPPQQTTEFDPSLAPTAAHYPEPAPPRTVGPRPEAGNSQWPTSRPATLPPPLPPQSRPAPLATLPPPAPSPRSRPAPLAAAAMRPSGTAEIPAAKSGGTKAGIIIAGVVGVLVIAAAAAWQFAPRDKAAGLDPTVGAASAAATTPVLAPPTVVATPPAPVTAPVSPPVATTVPPPVATAVPVVPSVDPVRPTGTAVPPPSARPVPTTARVDTPSDPVIKPPLTDRTAVTSLPVTAAASAVRPRPLGQPVPHGPETTTAGSTGSTTSSSYGNPSGTPATNYGTPAANSSTANSSERPRPLGQPAQRDTAAVGRPVPQPVQPAQPVQSAAQNIVDPHATSARDSCGKRVFVALAICMDERCEDPRWRNSSECVKVLERKRQRENR
jgi:serine/threonine protein kinase